MKAPDVTVDEQPLDADAHLARIAEGAHEHRWTAQSRSAEASTMAPALPPSSEHDLLAPARSFIFQPTPGEPVKVNSLKRSSSTSRSPSERSMGIETAPSGRPASSMISATASIVSGSREGGLSTMEQPAAMAGRSCEPRG